MSIVQTLALAALSVLFFARIPSALHYPETRLSWGASGVGALALFTVGTIVPPHILDSALGNENDLYLIQYSLTTIAFWMVCQAALSEQSTALRPAGLSGNASGVLVVALIAGYTSSFLLIRDRQGTSNLMIRDQIEQVPALLAGLLYMTSLIFVSGVLLLGLRRQTAKTYAFFRAGAVLVILACAAESFALLAGHFDAFSTQVRNLGYSAFGVFFYPGILLIVGGIAVFTLQLRRQHRQLRAHIRQVSNILRTRDFALPATVPESDPLDTLVDLIVSTQDLIFVGDIQLTNIESAELALADTWASSQVPNIVDDVASISYPLRTGA